MERPLKIKEVEKRLKTWVPSKHSYHGGGISESYLISLDGPSGERMKAIWKPAVPDSQHNKDPRQIMYNEIAAAHLGQSLGIKNIPAIIKRSFNFHNDKLTEGSLQEFIEGASQSYNNYLEQSSIEEMFLLDFITGNRDRHSLNVLYKNNQVIKIDHGFTFLDPYGYFSSCNYLEADEITESTLRLIKKASLIRAAKTLKVGKVTKTQAERALIRLEIAKARPIAFASHSEVSLLVSRASGAMATVAVNKALLAAKYINALPGENICAENG